MNENIIFNLLKKHSDKNDLTDLFFRIVYDVKWIGFNLDKNNIYSLSFKTKQKFGFERKRTRTIKKSKNKLNELVEIHYCLLWLEKMSDLFLRIQMGKGHYTKIGSKGQPTHLQYKSNFTYTERNVFEESYRNYCELYKADKNIDNIIIN